MNDVRNADAARLGNALKPRRDIDAIAKDIVAIDDDVAHIDTDAELDLLVRRHISIACRHRALNVDGATNRVDCTGELYQGAIARSLHDAAAMLGDLGIDDFAPACLECSKSAFLVDAHQPTVAGDIGSKDRSQPPFNTRFGHKIARPSVISSGV